MSTKALDLAQLSSTLAVDGTSGSVGISAPLDLNSDLIISDKIVHSGDTNTAIRFPADDTVTVETNGSERMRIDTSGKVGIGTTSPVSRLEIATASNVNALTVGSRGTSTSNALVHLSTSSIGTGMSMAAGDGIDLRMPSYANNAVRTALSAESYAGAFPNYSDVQILLGSSNSGSSRRAAIVYNGADNALSFRTGATGSHTTQTLSGTERARIHASGGVSIGNTTDPGATNLSVAGAINGIPLRPGVLDPENRIINGAFDFWQRGTSHTTAGYGSADRWAQVLSGGTAAMSRQSFTVGDTLGSNSPTFFLRQSVSGQSLTTHYAAAYQAIEGVRSYAGQTITVLGWARRSSGTGNMALEAAQFFGTGGSPSAAVNSISPTIVTLTGSWAAFSVTMTIPSITGKTLGSNGNDFLSLNFWTSAGSDFNARTNSLGLQTIGVDLWGIHIKVGTHTADATSLYRQPELGTELARCQRYYEKSFATGVAPANNLGTVPSGAETLSGPSNGGGFSPNMYWNIRFKVVKRAVPTFIAFNPLADSPNTWRTYASGAGAETTVTPETVSTNGVGGIVARASASLAIGAWTADAEL